MLKIPKLKKGFTLIELLVVIAIIGILVGVGVVSYTRAVRISRDNKRKTDLEQLRQALETYRAENNTYPSALGWDSALESGDYINTVPTDPKSGSYEYRPGSAPITTYSLCAYLEVDPAGTVTAACNISCGVGTCNYEVQNP